MPLAAAAEMTMAIEKTGKSRPPIPLLIAVALELAIVATFMVLHSGIGLLLCAAYAWFSATWSFLARVARDELDVDD
jgi:hypothetical protein